MSRLDLSDQELDDIILAKMQETPRYTLLENDQLVNLLKTVSVTQQAVLELQTEVRRLTRICGRSEATISQLSASLLGSHQSRGVLNPVHPDAATSNATVANSPTRLEFSSHVEITQRKQPPSASSYTEAASDHRATSANRSNPASKIIPRPLKRRRRMDKSPSPSASESSGSDSDGPKKVWPRPGPITLEGRQMLQCDNCEGWVHRSCAGVAVEKDMSKETFFCPVCSHSKSQVAIRRGGRGQKKPLCLRSPCSFQDVIFPEEEEAVGTVFYMEKLVGRRAIRRDEHGVRHFEYLVKWDGYPLQDATWEKPENITGIDTARSRFADAAGEHNVSLRTRTSMLPEALAVWSAEGNLISAASRK